MFDEALAKSVTNGVVLKKSLQRHLCPCFHVEMLSSSDKAVGVHANLLAATLGSVFFVVLLVNFGQTQIVTVEI